MTEDQRLLLEEASEPIRAAEFLLDNHFPGFAASRVYYAMFHAAQALLDSRGLSFSSHSATIAAFGREFAKPGYVRAELHRWLIEAQDVRLTSDYDPSARVSPESARDLIQHAKDFVKAARDLLV